jgi:hypothetical protein
VQPVEVESGGIDWGIEVEGAGEASGSAATIDWGITSEEPAPTAGGTIDWVENSAVATDAPSAINWDIETTESGSVDDAALSSSPSLSTPSSSASSVSTLESDSVRHSFLGVLQELEAFLAERAHDHATIDDLAAAAFEGQGVLHILALQSQQTTQTYLVSGTRARDRRLSACECGT